MSAPSSRDGGLSTARLLKLLLLLWLAGAGMRITILAVPPVIPLIHDDLHLSETEVGLLVSLPLVLFALAAVPGSLLVSRLGTSLTLTLGLVVTALASAGRGAASDVLMLYAATMVMGFGIAIMQPTLPTLVHEWLPDRIGFGTAVGTNGMLVGVTMAPALTIPVVLPLVGQSWRLDLVVWAAPVFLTALLFFALSPRAHWQTPAKAEGGRRWWPDWGSSLTWLLGLSFGSNNSIYFGTNAFLPDYLTSIGRGDLIGAALGWLNGAQLLASFALIVLAERVQRRTWPFLVFGAMTLVALFGIVSTDGNWIVFSASVVGFATSVTFVMLLALPPVLTPNDVHRTAAGMFTISYSCAVIIPIVSGSIWDLTAIPWLAFVPLCLCAVTLGTLGAVVSLRRPQQQAV